ncbi:hypothetical protein G5600_18935 [Escherichia coli]|nr:hypothetical protein [Escherichia coli]VCV94963.1 hypothetical protein BANRA_00233 [Escherichia coli]
MERYFIGVDLGGTETKAGIYTAEGREIGVSSQVLPLLSGNDSNLLIVFYVQIMPDDFVMQLHRF